MNVKLTAEQNTILASCLHAVLSDDVWRDIGFPKRPKYGNIIQRMRPAWRVQLEKQISIEILATFTAAYVCAQKVDRNDLPLMISAVFANEGVVTAMGFSNGQEAITELLRSIQEYSDTNPVEWFALLSKKIALQSLPDKDLAKSLFAGVVKYGVVMRDMVWFLSKSESPE